MERLVEYVLNRGVEILFGVASFHGTDAAPLAQPLSWLHHNHLAPEALRPVARPDGFQRMDLIAKEDLDRRAYMRRIPPLIKATVCVWAVRWAKAPFLTGRSTPPMCC